MVLIHKRELIVYEAVDGKLPFVDWLDYLRDRKGRAFIRARLDRLEHGNAGKCEPVGEEFMSLRFTLGLVTGFISGKMVKRYYPFVWRDKSTQNKDIRKAHEYWNDYKTGGKHETLSR